MTESPKNNLKMKKVKHFFIDTSEYMKLMN